MTTHDSDNASGGDLERWTDAPRGFVVNPKGEWCRYDEAAARIRELEQHVARDAKDAARYRIQRMAMVRAAAQTAESLAFNEFLVDAIPDEDDGPVTAEGIDEAFDKAIANFPALAALAAQPSTPAEDEKV